MVLQINPATQHMTMIGSFTGDKDGVHVDATVVGNAVSPFANLPPTANAGPDQTVTCGGLAHLNGSGTTDPNNNLFIFAWSENGTTIALGQQADVRLPPGQHTVTLKASDTYNGVGTDSVVVNVVGDTTPPTFTSVPGALTISTCNAPNIGQATAIDSCGGTVTITSNAPAKFPLGNTTVTYTARDTAGNTATATQVVTAILGDNASCCPAGTNIIMGTSNNDVLSGTAGSDCIIGLGAQDRIFGNGGNDFISGGDGDDIIDGGAGDDTIFGGSGQDNITGGIGNDNLNGGDGDDTISGGDGADTINGGEGQDHLFGDAGNDALFGMNGDDELHGGDGNDVLNGGGIHDRCFGGPGVNTLITCERVLPGP
jgi:Ca2+-binding RTX toxin-like protein